MDRRKYAAARRSLRKELSAFLAIAALALRQRLKRSAGYKKLDQRDPHWEVRIRKNVYLRIRRSLRNQLYAMAQASLVVRNPSAFVEKMLVKIDAHDKEAVRFPMTARDWL